jgi:hypothetical protein
MLEPSEEPRQYKYNSLFELSQYVLAIVCVILIFVSLSSIISLVQHLLNPDGLDSTLIISRLKLFVGSILEMIFFFFLIYSLPSIQVEEWGLRLKAFPLKTFELKWSDISYVKQVGWRSSLYKRKATVVVVRNGLTRFHRLCGIIYGHTIQPSFVVSQSISDYDHLLRAISDGVKKGRRAVRQNQS